MPEIEEQKLNKKKFVFSGLKGKLGRSSYLDKGTVVNLDAKGDLNSLNKDSVSHFKSKDEDNNIYAISINKPKKSLRIHLMSCKRRILHDNEAENQIHIPNLTFDIAKEIFNTSTHENKNFCFHCLKELVIDKSNVGTKILADKIIGDMGGTVESLLINELSIIQGFLKAIEILKRDYKFFDEIDQSKIISLMVKEAMQDSKGSLNPIYLGKRAKEYLFDLSIKSNI